MKLAVKTGSRQGRSEVKALSVRTEKKGGGNWRALLEATAPILGHAGLALSQGVSRAGPHWFLATFSPDFASAVAPVLLLESHCAAARDTVQCLCVVKSNPEPSVAFELPSRNVTVNESEREFVYSERSGLVLTSILTLRGQAQAPPRVICTARNLYGAKSLELPFQGAREWHGLGVGATGGSGLLLDPSSQG